MENLKKGKTFYYSIAAKSLSNYPNSYHKGQKVLLEGFDNTLENVQKRMYISVNVGRYWDDDADEIMKKLPITEIHKVVEYSDDTLIQKAEPKPTKTSNDDDWLKDVYKMYMKKQSKNKKRKNK